MFRFQLLKGAGREITFRMMLRNDDFALDESEYTVDVYGSTTCYASVGIVVGVKGPCLAIKSTAQVPWKMLSLGTNE